MSNPANRLVAPIEPLSDLHAMLATVERHHTASFLNRVANDPSVYPWVKGYSTGPLDLSSFVANPANVLFMGEHGGIFFVMLGHGLYEAHSQVLPKGRGPWMLSFTRAALHWMFTRTDAMEILTRCPQGHLPALTLAKRIGGVYEFTHPRGWIKDNDPIPADIYALRIQDWMRKASGLENAVIGSTSASRPSSAATARRTRSTMKTGRTTGPSARPPK